MNVLDAIARRRSIRKLLDRPLERGEIEPLLDAAAAAPNHRLTQPWRFYVLGPEARHKWGLALGERKAKKIEEAAAKAAMREKIATEHREQPALIAIAMVLSEVPETREEDYAAVMMAVQNLMLAAVARGLGTHMRTGAIMDDPAARAAVGIRDGERIVATISVGVPTEDPPARERHAASTLTTWTE
jgi:nitroreductase